MLQFYRIAMQGSTEISLQRRRKPGLRNARTWKGGSGGIRSPADMKMRNLKAALLCSLHDVLNLLSDDLPGAGSPRLCLGLLEFLSLQFPDVRLDPVINKFVPRLG